ncbi:MAG: DUF2911 domain-containing protein [candidate division KSB1 bacterium]|nr:DUF2911 domain-containing protein [candidate division KSB1 bacterium]MDZ7366857.1 DUF2911 domain-containing protein [candidate division KSB1 bacterium]MDZ7405136.1 DUF2911 domain-containing protein [candidate division KSB1 bacterium]
MKTFFRLAPATCLLVALFLFMRCGKKEEAKTENAETTPAAEQQAPASNRGTASATFGSATVSINYGRPQLRGRDMLAQATDGMVWRMGMNEATEIKTGVNLKFGETVIPPGAYSLWMKKISSGKWHLIFNKKTGIWGTEYSAADDFAEVPMTMSVNSDTVEAFTIELAAANETSGTLKAMWGTAVLSADFTASAGTM